MPTMEIDPSTVAANANLLTVPALTDATFRAVQAIRNIPGPAAGDPPSMTFWKHPANTATNLAASKPATDWANIIPIRLYGANTPVAGTINGNPAQGYGYGGAPAGATTNGALIADDVAILPVGMTAWTIAFLCQINSGGSGVLLGTADANGFNVGVNASTGYVSFTPQSQNNAQIVRPNVDKRGAGPQVYVLGFTPSAAQGATTGTLTLRNNGAQAAQNTSALPLANGRYREGGFGLSTNLSSTVNALVGEVTAFSGVDLTAVGWEKYLAFVEARLRGLAGV